MTLAEKYTYEIYKTGSFSKAAKKMYIAQPSLSLTIKKHEESLGFTIFNRSTSPVSLSREGKIYIEYLEEILEHEKNMYKRIKTISNPIEEKIAVGNAFFVSRFLLPEACRKFRESFPNVKLRLNMGETLFYAELLEMLDDDTLNMLIGFSFDKEKYTGIPLMEERYIICLKKDYPGADALLPYAHTYKEIISGKVFPQKVISDYSLFKNIEFLKINSSAIIWRDMANFLMHCPVSPCNVHSCRNIDVIYDMMLCGLGAAITTESVIHYHPATDDVLYFIVDTPKPTCQSYIIHKKNIEISESMAYFIDILKESAQKTMPQA